MSVKCFHEQKENSCGQLVCCCVWLFHLSIQIYFFIVRLFLAMITCQEVIARQHLICHTLLPLHHFPLQVQTSYELNLSLLWTSYVNFFHKCIIDILLKSQWKLIEWKKIWKIMYFTFFHQWTKWCYFKKFSQKNNQVYFFCYYNYHC